MGSLELKAFGHLLALASVIIVGCGKSCVPVAVRDVRTAKLPFAVLDTEQQTLFKTYRPAVNPDRAWDDLTLPQQIEFGGGTRVVAFGCRLVGCVQSVKEIHGDEPSQPSEDQFNVEVLWDPKALSQKDLPGWSKHIALLHKGQFGYQENRDHNPFLGLVVLFDKQHPVEVIHGQFHIGFRSWFAHYNLVNGNIGDRFNYACYQRWYSKFDDLQPSSEMGSAGVAAVTSLRENKAVRAPLEDAIQDFLESWYVKRDYSRFQSYIATENGFRAQIKSDKLSISQDQLEGGVFASAFAGRAAGVGEIGGLADAIYFPGIAAEEKAVEPESTRYDRNKSPLFGVFRPDELPPGSVLPTQAPKDQAAKFLYDLSRKYELRIVFYATKRDVGLLEETVVSYWMRERDGVWKLAALRGTDW